MNKKKHLTNAVRTKIKTLLSQGFSIRSVVFAIFIKCCTYLEIYQLLLIKKLLRQGYLKVNSQISEILWSNCLKLIWTH